MSARIPARQRVEHRVVDGAHTAQLSHLAITANELYVSEKQQAPTSQRVGSQPKPVDERDSVKTADTFDELYAQAEIVYTLQALPRRKWDEAKEAHIAPAVEGEDRDEKPSALFEAILHESIVDPDSDPYDPKPLLTERECVDLADSLTAVQWKALCDDLWGLNEWGAGIPRLSMGSLLRRTIDADSTPQQNSESPTPVSRVGSPGSSTPTETPTDSPAPNVTPGAQSSSESPSGMATSAT